MAKEVEEKLTKKQLEREIENWVIQDLEIVGGVIVSPIPMSITGNIVVDEIKSNDTIAPIVDVDKNTIYCFSRELAKKLLLAGHDLNFDQEKFFTIKTDEVLP